MADSPAPAAAVPAGPSPAAASTAVTATPAPPVPAVQGPPLTYRERLAQFRILEEKRVELIEELLEKLEKTEAKLAQTELDLNSEQNVRRTLQAEVVQARGREDTLAQNQARRPFVMVLIDADADGFLFLDKYLTRRSPGGENLADELLLRIREFLHPLYPDASTLDILIRVYANLEGLANYLVRQDKVRNLGQLRAMSTGFSGRVSSFDWVDTGVGKEGSTGRKVRENLGFYAENTHCRHILVAAAPMDIPSNLLQTLPAGKITMIEGSVPLPLAYTAALPTLQTLRLPTIFPPPPPPMKSPKPILRGRNGMGSMSGGVGGPQLQLMQQENDEGGSTWLVIQPERSKSQGGGGGMGGMRGMRRGASEEDGSNLSISIGPDNTVSVDSGRRRRMAER